MTPFHKKLTAIDSLFATFSDPYGTAKHLLLERGRPPYVMTSFISILLALVGPAMAYRSSTQVTITDRHLCSAVLFTVASSAILFITTVTVLLKALRIKASIHQIVASVLYSLCPCIPLALGFYVLSYGIDGNWALVQYLATGTAASGARSLELLPFGVFIAILFAIRVFANCIQVLSNGSAVTSSLISLICSAALYGSYLISLGWVEALYPGYTGQTAGFFSRLFDSRR
jgi:hypothetical protein